MWPAEVDFAASLAIQAGASVIAVARLLGHESAATTLNDCAGLFPSDLDDVPTDWMLPRVRPPNSNRRRTVGKWPGKRL